MQNNIIQGSTKNVYLKVYLTGTTTPATGKTVAVTLSKNGGAFANPSAGATNATEIASGWYSVALSATDTNTVGPLVVLGQAASCDNVDPLFDVVPGVVVSSVPYPSVNSFSAGSGLPVNPYEGTAAAVSASSITLASADVRTANSLVGWTVEVVSATTFAGQRAVITAYNTGTQVATVTWPTGTPTGTVTYNLYGPVVVGTNNDKTGYSFAQSFPANFAALAIDSSGRTQVQVGSSAGQINATAGAVPINLAQAGLTVRALDAVADSALTVGDALVCAISGTAGKEVVNGTAFTIATPSTGTVIRTKTLNSSTAPTSAT